MIDRICVSVNNNCNLKCKYCHFHEKEVLIKSCDMDVIAILNNVKHYIDDNNIEVFKIGFVGNGEPLLEYDKLRSFLYNINCSGVD